MQTKDRKLSTLVEKTRAATSLVKTRASANFIALISSEEAASHKNINPTITNKSTHRILRITFKKSISTATISLRMSNLLSRISSFSHHSLIKVGNSCSISMCHWNRKRASRSSSLLIQIFRESSRIAGTTSKVTRIILTEDLTLT